MRRVIRIGDPTDHGGHVLTGDEAYLVHGRAVARLGDLCSCPRPGHDRCTIREGDPDHLVGGLPVAFEGCRTSCGAALCSTLEAYTSG